MSKPMYDTSDISSIYLNSTHIQQWEKGIFGYNLSQLSRKGFTAVCFSALLIQGICVTKSGGMSSVPPKIDEMKKHSQGVTC